jgi:hypothetical protein
MNDKLSLLARAKRDAKRNSSTVVVSNSTTKGRRLPGHVAKELMRKEAKAYASGVHGNFCCERCGNYYYASFGKYGYDSSVSFAKEQWLCLDCIERMGKGRFVVA